MRLLRGGEQVSPERIRDARPWSYQSGSGEKHCEIAVDPDGIFVAHGGESEKRLFRKPRFTRVPRFAYYGRTGDLRWSRAAEHLLDYYPHQQVCVQHALLGDDAAVALLYGHAACFDLRTGEPRWVRPTGNRLRATLIGDCLFHDPAQDSGVAMRDLRCGEVKWSRHNDDEYRSSEDDEGLRMFAAGSAAAAPYRSKIVGYRLADGADLWEHTMEIDDVEVLGDGRLLVNCDREELGGCRADAAVIDVETGECVTSGERGIKCVVAGVACERIGFLGQTEDDGRYRFALRDRRGAQVGEYRFEISQEDCDSFEDLQPLDEQGERWIARLGSAWYGIEPGKQTHWRTNCEEFVDWSGRFVAHRDGVAVYGAGCAAVGLDATSGTVRWRRPGTWPRAFAGGWLVSWCEERSAVEWIDPVTGDLAHEVQLAVDSNPGGFHADDKGVVLQVDGTVWGFGY